VINPATEEPVAVVPLATKQQLDDAVDAASRAFPAWSATPVEKRQELLSKLGDLVEIHQAQFAELLVKEVGKPRVVA
jgi:acyl-CoA reductase-like NAD-dependent aldehyde dehydrogenase